MVTPCDTRPIAVDQYIIAPTPGPNNEVVLSPESPVEDGATTQPLAEFLKARYAQLTEPIHRPCHKNPFGDVTAYIHQLKNGFEVAREVEAYLYDRAAEPGKPSQHGLEEPYLLASVKKCLTHFETMASSFGARFDAKRFQRDVATGIANALQPIAAQFAWIPKQRAPFSLSGRDYYLLVRAENLARAWTPQHPVRRQLGRILDVAGKHAQLRPE